MIKIKTISILSVIIAMVFMLSACTAKKTGIVEYKSNPDLSFVKDDWKGNIVINNRYKNDINEEPVSTWTAVKWKFSRNPQRKEKKAEDYHIPVSRLTSLPDGDAIIWLGHATFIIQLNGVRLITDPSLFNIPTYKRHSELPCDPEILTGIDYMLISHDHHDHFNIKSIKLLSKNNPEMKVLGPLDSQRLFNKNKKLKEMSLQEAGWWQEYQLDKDIRIVFVPARHWGRRSLNDTNKTLWGGFIIISGDKKVYFGGDTAYGSMFNDIHEVFGDMDICILPIGAYAPAYMMSRSHINPEEAVRVFEELGGKILIPMHYGTFDLSDEPLGEPIRKLKEAASKHHISDRIKELRVGEIFRMN
ncbi:MAG: MBL fold metallo-hydrolase [Bacteroidales bacterium]|jgi:L-ascorbate metabolism protein UlaG (beta-lactamase superfamily)|nr:MBL fold metallo-hydrolase [Bacteroidales bacterium]